VTKEGLVKIADFGLARIYGFTMALTSVVVTLWYRSPEVLLHSTYSSSVDIWSVGCIFAELYMKRPLFIGHSDIDQLYKIFEVLGLPSDADWPVNSVIPLKSFHSNANLSSKSQRGAESLKKFIPALDEHALDLLMRFLDFNLSNRITAKDALAHKFFTHDSNEDNNENSKITYECIQTMDEACIERKLFKDVDLNENDDNDENEMRQNVEMNENEKLSSLPDITNMFQPNILKRKRGVQQQNK
jgi:cyclin-dependent kinase 6